MTMRMRDCQFSITQKPKSNIINNKNWIDFWNKN